MKFIKEPDTLIIRAGTDAKIVWEYEYSIRKQFKDFSPVWYLVSSGSSQTELAFEDAKNSWAWTISPQCPETYKGRIYKEDQASLIIKNTKTEDSGYYGFKLKLADGKDLTSEGQLKVYGKHTLVAI